MNRSRNTFVLFLIVFADMMGFSVIFPIFPETIRYFLHQSAPDPIFQGFYSLAEFLGESSYPDSIIVLFGGILGSVYSILQFVFSPVWGRMSDTLGRKKILLLTSLGNFLGYLLWLFSTNFTLFVLSRIITGAMGGNISVASAAMADATSREDRAKGMGMIGAGIGLGFIFGPTLGGLFSGIEIKNWFPFLSKVELTVFSFSALISVLISFLNLFLVVLFLKETKISSHTQNLNRSTVHPILDMFTPGYRGLIFISLIYFTFIYSFSGFEFSLNFFLNESLKFSPREIGFTFLFLGIIIILIQGGFIRKVSGKISEVTIALSGSAFLVIGYLGIIVVAYNHSVSLLFVSLGILAVGSALMHPALSSIASLGSDPDDQGKNLGIFRSFGSLGRAVSPFTFSLLYFGYTEIAVFFFALALTLGFTVFIISNRNQKARMATSS